MRQKIIDYIKENNLDLKTRNREYVTVECFLSNLLHKQGLTLQAIGDIFNRTHATIIHSINTHNGFIFTNDVVYKMYIQKELDIFTPLVEMKRNIFNEVLNARNTTDLTTIVRRIKNNEYEHQPKDFI